MAGVHSPAKRVTGLVVLGIVGLVVALFAGTIELLGLVGVVVSLTLLAALVLAAAVAGASLQAAFEVLARAVAVVRTAVVRLRNRR